MKRDRYRCQLCGRTAAQGVQIDVDHRVPLAAGGTNDVDNLWLLCWPCNNGKATEQL